MNKNQGTINSTIPVCLLVLILVGLKVGHVITLSWLWILSPLWLPIGIVCGFWALAFVVMLVVAMVRR